MEKPTFTAIDYNSLENKVIEGLVGDYYQMVKNTFETVLYRRIHIQDSPRGLCADLIEVSRNIYKQYDQYDLPDRIFLWRQVIKSWFTPQRFNLTYVYFGYSTPLPMEANEIAMKIHDIQRMIISRPGFRMNQEMFRQYGNGNCNKG